MVLFLKFSSVGRLIECTAINYIYTVLTGALKENDGFDAMFGPVLFVFLPS